MQREVIEHPDYIPEKVKAKLNLRAGEDRGRIYRIVPKGITTLWDKRWDLKTNAICFLANSNQWVRMTAQRLLVERQETVSLPLLKSWANSEDTVLRRLHSLWTLEGLHEVNPEICEKALADAAPEIRENALLLCEPFLANSVPLKTKVIALLNDSSPRVRFQ